MPVLSWSFDGGRDPRKPARKPANANDAKQLHRQRSGRDRALSLSPSARNLRKKKKKPRPDTSADDFASTQPDRLDPQSQSLSRSYGSNLPISLTHIHPSTRGCSPWRPDADIGTDERERPKNVTLPPDFQGPAENDHGRRRNATLFGIAFDS